MGNTSELKSRSRGYLEVDIYRKIDAIINRQIKLYHKIPENLGDRRYRHSLNPDIKINVGEKTFEVAEIVRLDIDKVDISVTGKKTVDRYNHYWIFRLCYELCG